MEKYEMNVLIHGYSSIKLSVFYLFFYFWNILFLK